MADSQFPEALDSNEKQVAEAKQLAAKHLGVPASNAKAAEIQGCFSKTFEVTMEDDRLVIIQLRIEPLATEPFAIARNLLGDKVPNIEAIEAPDLNKHKVWPFYMTRIPGKTWLEHEAKWEDSQRIACIKSLGKLFSQCFVPGGAEEAVDQILENLRRCRALDRDDVRPFYGFIDQLIEEAPRLRKLPLFYSHFDLNEMNVLAEDSGEITGIVDWEMAVPQPFGMSCSCIHFLAGEIVSKQFREKDAYEAIERGFWSTLMDSADPTICALLESNLEAVQTSVMIGTLFRIISIEGENIFVGQVALKALPTLMRYKIPALRGSAKPYDGGIDKASKEPRRNPQRAARDTSQSL